MLVLVLDTSTPAVTAALVVVGAGPPDVLAERVTVDPRRHGELLAPAVEAVLAEAGRSPGDLAAVVAGVGPGPYTGLRIGLVTAAALADALALPTYGVCSLDAIAFGAALAPHLLVATDARRREVYWATYGRDGVRRSGPAVNRPADVAAAAAAAGSTAAAGAGAVMYDLGVPAGPPQFPPAAALAALAADRVTGRAPSEPLVPLYLRRPDATEPAPPKAVRQ